MHKGVAYSDRYYSQLYKLALTVAQVELANKREAEDIVQEVLTRFWLRTLSARHEPIRDPTKWVRASARYSAIWARRKPSKEIPLHDGLQKACYEIEDWHIDLAQALSALPIDDQILIRKRYYEGMSLSDIANSIGKTERTVSRKLRRIESFLARVLGPKDTSEAEKCRQEKS